MGYSMLVFGRLKTPPGCLEILRRAGVDPFAEQEGWLRNLRPHARLNDIIAAGADVWTKLPGIVSQRVDNWFELEASGMETVFRCWLGEDSFLDYGPILAMLFRQAARLGCSGELVFLEEQTLSCSSAQSPETCYVVRISSGNAEIRHPSEAEQLGYMESPAFKKLAPEILNRLGLREEDGNGPAA
jgi:hypothetical protein